MKTFLNVIGAVICLPISFYITYSLLCYINADRLLWFLFWVYIPIVLLVNIGLKLLEKGDNR